jgi:methylated-DNA-protein-cysteine methyltransferase-like protein
MTGFRSNDRGNRSAVRGPRPERKALPKRVAVRAKNKQAGTGDATDNALRIVDVVKRIPKGRVSTYGAIAEAAGLPRRARLVGTVLRTTAVKNVPWFRVINSSGRISLPQASEAYDKQRAKLEQEGIVFIGGRVDLRRFGWPASLASLDEFIWSSSEL